MGADAYGGFIFSRHPEFVADRGLWRRKSTVLHFSCTSITKGCWQDLWSDLVFNGFSYLVAFGISYFNSWGIAITFRIFIHTFMQNDRHGKGVDYGRILKIIWEKWRFWQIFSRFSRFLPFLLKKCRIFKKNQKTYCIFIRYLLQYSHGIKSGYFSLSMSVLLRLSTILIF